MVPCPAGPACAQLVGTLETHPLSRLLWRRLKPLVLGKLLFTPDTAFTRQLMAQVRTAAVLRPPSARMRCGRRVLKDSLRDRRWRDSTSSAQRHRWSKTGRRARWAGSSGGGQGRDGAFMWAPSSHR